MPLEPTGNLGGGSERKVIQRCLWRKKGDEIRPFAAGVGKKSVLADCARKRSHFWKKSRGGYPAAGYQGAGTFPDQKKATCIRGEEIVPDFAHCKEANQGKDVCCWGKAGIPYHPERKKIIVQKVERGSPPKTGAVGSYERGKAASLNLRHVEAGEAQTMLRTNKSNEREGGKAWQARA